MRSLLTRSFWLSVLLHVLIFALKLSYTLFEIDGRFYDAEQIRFES